MVFEIYYPLFYDHPFYWNLTGFIATTISTMVLDSDQSVVLVVYAGDHHRVIDTE